MSRPADLPEQFQLLLHAAVYWLLDTLRRWPIAAEIERIQLDTLQLRLIKIEGWVRELASVVRLHLASSHPGRAGTFMNNQG